MAQRGDDPRTVVFAFLDFNDGGAQRLALTTWRHLRPAAFRPRLMCVRGAGTLVPAARRAGVPVTVLGRLRRPRDWGAVPAIARRLRALEATVVHVPLYSRVSPYVRLAARLAGAPLVVAHEHCRAAPPTPARRLVDRLLIPGTRFVAVSHHDRRALMRLGVPRETIAVVHNGVECDRFGGRDRAAARARLGLSASRPIVLVPARLVARKGHVDLIAALAKLARQRGHASLPDVLCAGGGPLATVLPALVSAVGLDARVRFLGHRDDLPQLLAAADIVALPSWREGLPLALLEALAAGRPVVATAVGGVPEALEDGVTGRLVPPRDPAALADALGALLADPAARAAMGRRARATARTRFDAAAATRRLEAAYSRWLGDDRRVGRWR